MTFGYAVEKFTSARYVLAINPDRIQERLISAWVYNLINVEPERDIPDPDIRAEFEDHHKRMTSGIPKGQEGAVAASARALNDDDAMDEARWILEFLHRLEDFEEELAQTRHTN